MFLLVLTKLTTTTTTTDDHERSVFVSVRFLLPLTILYFLLSLVLVFFNGERGLYSCTSVATGDEESQGARIPQYCNDDIVYRCVKG